MAIHFSPCERSDEALIVASALGDIATQLRNSLDHRSLFSAQYNRKLTKKIELLESVRDDFMDYALSLQKAESEVIHEEIAQSGNIRHAALFQAAGASGSRTGGRKSP